MEQAVAKVLELASTGTNICTIRDCIDKCYDELSIKKMFPVSIEVNNFINNYSPFMPYCLADDDTFGVTYGYANSSGAKTVCSYQGFFNEAYLDYYKYTKEAFMIGKKTCKEDVRIKEISVAIAEVLSSYDNYISPIRNISGFMISDSKTVIPNVIANNEEMRDYNSLDIKIKKGESYFICVYTANTINEDLHGVFYKNPSLYYRTDKKRELKSKRERTLLNLVTQFGVGNIFGFADLIKKCEKKEYTKKIFGDLVHYRLVEPIYGLVLPDQNMKSFRYGETIIV
jgi:hypothetical protein